MRLAVGIEYDGSAYAGWQAQPHAPSVQIAVEQALGFVANHRLRVVCAGRTDAGVHALQQVVHFDTLAERPEHSWVFGANTRLPADIGFTWARRVPANFHARYGALVREYHYLIWNSPVRSPLLAKRVAHCRRPLDAGAMHAAAQTLLGEQDFSAFRAAACQSRSPVRRLLALDVGRRDDLIWVRARANAFLHHMVRNLAGTLMAVGRGEQDGDWPARLLIGRERRFAGVTAPAQGLYLARVVYPQVFGLPQRDPLPSLLTKLAGC